MSLLDLQSDFPCVDVEAEYRRACREYGRAVGLGWFQLRWLPRCRPIRPRRIDRETILRSRALDIAYNPAEPDGWPDWFGRKYPTLAPIGWSSAPLLMRQQFARAKLAEQQSTEGTSMTAAAIDHRPHPRGAGQKSGTFASETVQLAICTRPRNWNRGRG